jgi:hypothetical protein
LAFGQAWTTLHVAHISTETAIKGSKIRLDRVPQLKGRNTATLAERLPQPPLTRNQVELMQIDTTASETCSGFAHLGFRRDRSKVNSKRHLREANEEFRNGVRRSL